MNTLHKVETITAQNSQINQSAAFTTKYPVRISKETDPFLYDTFDFRKAYLGGAKTDKATIIKKKTNDLPLDIFTFFCENSIHSNVEDMELKKELYYKTWFDLFDNLFRSSVVEYVSGSFLNNAINNFEKVFQCVADNSVHDIFGRCAGFLLFGKCCLSYSITDNCSWFKLNNRKDSIHSIYRYFVSFDNRHSLRDTLATEVEDKNAYIAMLIGIAILLIKKYADTETTLISAGVRRSIPNSEEAVVVNKTPFKINFIDCSWLKTIVRTEGFAVRGHFRLQHYGAKRSLIKLIYIKPFMKHGYVRRAGKLIEQEKEIRQTFNDAA